MPQGEDRRDQREPSRIPDLQRGFPNMNIQAAQNIRNPNGIPVIPNNVLRNPENQRAERPNLGIRIPEEMRMMINRNALEQVLHFREINGLRFLNTRRNDDVRETRLSTTDVEDMRTQLTRRILRAREREEDRRHSEWREVLRNRDSYRSLLFSPVGINYMAYPEIQNEMNTENGRRQQQISGTVHITSDDLVREVNRVHEEMNHEMEIERDEAMTRFTHAENIKEYVEGFLDLYASRFDRIVADVKLIHTALPDNFDYNSFYFTVADQLHEPEQVPNYGINTPVPVGAQFDKLMEYYRKFKHLTYNGTEIGNYLTLRAKPKQSLRLKKGPLFRWSKTDDTRPAYDRFAWIERCVQLITGNERLNALPIYVNNPYKFILKHIVECIRHPGLVVLYNNDDFIIEEDSEGVPFLRGNVDATIPYVYYLCQGVIPRVHLLDKAAELEALKLVLDIDYGSTGYLMQLIPICNEYNNDILVVQATLMFTGLTPYTTYDNNNDGPIVLSGQHPENRIVEWDKFLNWEFYTEYMNEDRDGDEYTTGEILEEYLQLLTGHGLDATDIGGQVVTTIYMDEESINQMYPDEPTRNNPDVDESESE